MNNYMNRLNGKYVKRFMSRFNKRIMNSFIGQKSDTTRNRFTGTQRCYIGKSVSFNEKLSLSNSFHLVNGCF